MIKTVIFDMDGVIIDSEPVHMAIERQLFEEYDLKISKEKHHSYVGMSSLDMWTSIVRELKLQSDPKEIVARKNLLYQEALVSDNGFELIKGVSRTIGSLYEGGLKLVLASSAARKEIELVLDKSGLRKYFPIIVSGAELEKSKPDPLIFTSASHLAATSPQYCCVIEDSENGVIAAKAAGMSCIGFRNPNSGNQDLSKADKVIESFLEFHWKEELKF